MRVRRNGDCPLFSNGRRASSPSLRPAVTLVELLVVIVILGVATSMIVPRMGRSIGRQELHEAAARFVQTARTVRELAISSQRTCEIQLDLDRGGYDVAVQSSRGSGGQMEAVRASWLKSDRLPERIKVAEFRTPRGETTFGGVQQVKFFADGTSSGASIRLSSEAGEYAIVVYPHNGRVVGGEDQNVALAQDQYDRGD